MAYTLEDIRDMVNAELENHEIMGSFDFIGDGTTTQWYVAPPGFFVVPDTLVVKVDGVAAGGSVDGLSGILTMESAPAGTKVCRATFKYHAWSDDVIDSMINATINSMFPSIYVRATDTITTDGTSFEYDVDDTVEFVIGVEFKDTSSTNYTKKRNTRYTIFTDGTHKVIRFFTAPAAGTVRIHTISRLLPLSSDSDTLAAAGIPERAADALVSGSVYRCLLQKSAPRIRSDVAVASMGTGSIFPSMMAQVAQSWLMRFQFQMASIRMAPWSYQ